MCLGSLEIIAVTSPLQALGMLPPEPPVAGAPPVASPPAPVPPPLLELVTLLELSELLLELMPPAPPDPVVVVAAAPDVPVSSSPQPVTNAALVIPPRESS
jgi:hypothetical protein